jgi:uncharacterized protein (DUF885 family)
MSQAADFAALQARLAKIGAGTLPEPDRIDASVMGSQLAFLLRNLDRRVHEKALDAFLEEPLRGVEWTLQEMAPAGDGAAHGTKADWQAVAARAAAAFRDSRKGLFDLFFEPGGEALAPAFDRDRFAAGEAEYSWALRNNLGVTRTAREQYAYGKSEVAATLGEMTALARRIAGDRKLPDASPGGVLSLLANDIPKNDAEMLSWYQEACRRLVAYGRRTGMFDLPADYQLDVVFTPPPLRDTIDAAYYPAPQFKKGGVGQFYITPTGDDSAALREHARAAIASLAAHEGFPGHDWYYQFMRGRAASIPAIRWLTPGGVEDSASMWEDSMSSEGWALYCERLVGEPRAEFPGGFYTPEERLF